MVVAVVVGGLDVLPCAHAKEALYPVNRTVPGLEQLGVLCVLGEFVLGLPMEGLAGLAAGYVLQVTDTTSPPNSSAFRGEAWERALQQVRGLQLSLPYGAWPSAVSQPPTVYVVDSAHASPLSVAASNDPGITLAGPLLILAPSNLTLIKGVSVSLPVNRALSRDSQTGNYFTRSAELTLVGHRFVNGKWHNLVGELKRGLDPTPAAAHLYSNVTHPQGPPDMLVVRSLALGVFAVMRLRTMPLVLTQETSGGPSQTLGAMIIWVVAVVLFGIVVVVFSVWRVATWLQDSEWLERRRCVRCGCRCSGLLWWCQAMAVNVAVAV